MRYCFWLLVAGCLILGCSNESGSEPEPSHDAAALDQIAEDHVGDSEAAAETGGGPCELVGNTCSAGCFPVYARPLNDTTPCLLPGELIMCASLSDAATVITCMVRSETGTIYAFPSTLTPGEQTGWRECSEGEAEKLGSATGECG